MAEWYHSGIEGYCKAAADLAGMEGGGGWSAFGSDLLPARFDRADKATKTWTLSRFRRGSGNRPSAFEGEWLAGFSAPLDIGQREELAVKNCVTGLMSSVARHDDAESPLAALLFREGSYRFAAGFADEVVPAIASGFLTEGYHSSDILRFEQNITELIGDLQPGDDASFRAFGCALVAALIYGPGHQLAGSAHAEKTIWRKSAGSGAPWLPECDDGIVVSQLFGDGCAYMGYSERFTGQHAVFFGRSGRLGEYLEACEEFLPGIDESLMDEVISKSKVIFPVSRSHGLVSNVHGLLVSQGQNWYFFDFSSNGTYVTSGGAMRRIRLSGAAVIAGDLICLGSGDLDPEMRYRHAATVLMSLHVTDRMG